MNTQENEVPVEKEKDMPPEKGVAAIKWLFKHAVPKPVTGTKAHNPNRKRGVGVTRKNKEQGKNRRKMSKSSRKNNRGKK